MRTVISKPLWLALLTVLLAVTPFRHPSMGAGNIAASVFDRLPGARPAGMGGAFTGLADDGFAVNWNPAGIVRLKQRELVSMYEVMTLDRSASYVAGAYPFEDGVTSFGVSWYRFGVDAIPVNDLDFTRVVSVDSTGNPIYAIRTSGFAEDVSNQMTFSFGRRINDFLAAGVNAKYVTQRIGEEDAYALGADLGMLLDAGNGVSLGATVRNIAQTMNWGTAGDREDNAPLGFTLGMAVDFKGMARILADFEKIENSELTYHIGAEGIVHDTFSIRVGLDDGKMTAGTSLRLNSWRIDYSYVDDTLGMNHKLSSTFRFDAPGGR